jgi:hypothetical protein
MSSLARRDSVVGASEESVVSVADALQTARRLETMLHTLDKSLVLR